MIWSLLLVALSVPLGLFVGWLLGPVSDELDRFRRRGHYFGDDIRWTLAKRWVAFWYWHD